MCLSKPLTKTDDNSGSHFFFSTNFPEMRATQSDGIIFRNTSIHRLESRLFSHIENWLAQTEEFPCIIHAMFRVLYKSGSMLKANIRRCMSVEFSTKKLTKGNDNKNHPFPRGEWNPIYCHDICFGSLGRYEQFSIYPFIILSSR